VDVGAAFIAHGETTKAVEPGERAFHDPAMPSQALARLDAASGNSRDNATVAASDATARVVVALVRMQLEGTATRPPTPVVRLAQGRDRIERGLQEERVMDISRREHYGEWDAAPVDDKMALRARFAAIRRIRAGLRAPLLAGTLAESSDARDQSIFSASARRWSSSQCKRSQTPIRFQSRRRRQHVIPLPQPNSLGSRSQPMPLLRTKIIPVKTLRSSRRGRPPLGLGGSGGSSGAMIAHSSSLTRSLLMPSVYHWFC
jgi:hypothetical protein